VKDFVWGFIESHSKRRKNVKEEVVTMRELNIRVMTWSLATFTLFSFVVCVLYRLIVPESMHLVQFLEITLPGFKWLSIGSFLIGLVESFLYGIYAGLVYTPIYNFYNKKWG
jgi:2TM family of unknown function (DUF5676)